ncbi:hypothetical protein GCM10027160_52650 [Streptomyces calidiresistens]
MGWWEKRVGGVGGGTERNGEAPGALPWCRGVRDTGPEGLRAGWDKGSGRGAPRGGRACEGSRHRAGRGRGRTPRSPLPGTMVQTNWAVKGARTRPLPPRRGAQRSVVGSIGREKSPLKADLRQA